MKIEINFKNDNYCVSILKIKKILCDIMEMLNVVSKRLCEYAEI